MTRIRARAPLPGRHLRAARPVLEAPLMHILIGAAVGAVFAVGMTVAMSLLGGRKPVWKHVALAALGGAVSGAVASATLGAGGFAAASLGRQVVGFGLGGAVGGATERVVENAVDGQPLHEGVGRATAIGGATGLISLGVTRATPVVTKALPFRLPRVGAPVVDETLGAARPLVNRVLTAPTPGTGSGVRRGLEARREALERDWVTIDLPLGAPASGASQDVSATAPTPAARSASPAPSASLAPPGEAAPADALAPTPGITGALAGF